MKYIILSISAFFLIACQGSNNSSGGQGTQAVSGYEVFRVQCVACHGQDGKMGLNGAQDLTQSTLTLEERLEVLTNGRGTMPSFRAILSQEEIKAVAEYTLKFSEQ